MGIKTCSLNPDFITCHNVCSGTGELITPDITGKFKRLSVHEQFILNQHRWGGDDRRESDNTAMQDILDVDQ